MSKSSALRMHIMVPPKTGKRNRVEDLLDQIKALTLTNDYETSKLEKIKAEYMELSTDEKSLLFKGILRKIETPKHEIEILMQNALSVSEDDPKWRKLLSEIHTKSESPRIRLFRKFINVSEGLKFLLDIRRDILAVQRNTDHDLGPLDNDLSHLFNSWFQNEFLVLQEITLRSPYSQIDYIQRHDMVHPMTRLEEMGNRLGHDRRCFALYHIAMPEEPVIFIEVALTKGITRSIHRIIGRQAESISKPVQFDTAIFYSINNTQDGLAGIGLGKLLIFQVVDFLKKTDPQVRTFSTLSPLPGFWKKYLKRILMDNKNNFKMTKERITGAFSQKSQIELRSEFEKQKGNKAERFSNILLGILSDPEWIENSVYLKYFEKPLSEIAYHYVAEEKDSKGRPLNPIANFHMSNGATVSKKNINFLGNRSQRGLEESCGMTVNYVYSQSWFKQVKRSVQFLLRLQAGLNWDDR